MIYRCGSCKKYLHYIPRTINKEKGVQLVCGLAKKEITWYPNHYVFDDNFEIEWCPRNLKE